MNKWISGARPRTLPAAVAPIVVATALAGHDWNLFRALLALCVSLALQIGVNFANDYSDGIKGTDDNRIGPLRLVASGSASAIQVRNAAILSFLLAACIGFILALQTSLWLIAIGALAISAAWGYTGGKNPYGYLGLGDLSVFVFFGLVATIGTYYVQTQHVTLTSLLIAIPMGSLSCAILAINNLRDRETDELVGKNTLAVRLGDRGARYLYISLLATAHIFAIATLQPWTALTLLALPITISLSRAILQGASKSALIPLLGKTGKLQLIFSALFAVGLLL
ncbi:unannotated protein [freshwater metagenome]|uniref:Unannotated protein n=1 Tax=freshwater metagenome TaxID=449393 RepID=A0A6J7XY41_9ZZZZ|nr:1,4-dihydroxy-2-naphthoate polyprenyltransferase [Actinomycetota bacterium]